MNAQTITQSPTLVARAGLSTIIEPGDAIAGALINALGPVAAFEAITTNRLQAALKNAGIGDATAREAVARWAPRTSAIRIMANLTAIDHTGVTVLDPDTVPQLADLGEIRPIALYARGNIDALTADRRIAITGARASTAYGEIVTSDIVSGLASHDVTVISGAAYGIDAAAHRTALAVGIPTIAVMAGGLNRTYPIGHSELVNQIAQHGTVLTELPMDTPPTKWRFQSRNRILAALAQATIITEAGAKSGTINTAGHAIELGRPLGSVPGPITSPASNGCHHLISHHGATLITSAKDALALLGVE